MISTCDVKKIQATDSVRGKKKKGLEIHVVITRECYHHRVFVSSLNSYHDGPFRVIGAF